MEGLYTTCRCVHCVHLHLDAGRRMTCDAFPAGIPAYIINGRFDHRVPCNPPIGFERVVHVLSREESGAA